MFFYLQFHPLNKFYLDFIELMDTQHILECKYDLLQLIITTRILIKVQTKLRTVGF